MKTPLRAVVARVLVGALLIAGTWTALGASQKGRESSPTTPGLEAARNLSLLTGVAISPLLGVGAVGAYQWWTAPQERRGNLHWFARPWFWVPALLLVGFLAAKDVFGTVAPTAFKKPFDVAEAVENKVSALIAAGAFLPLVISVFPQAPGSETRLLELSPLGAMGFAAIDAGAIGNALLVPFALAVFAVVWLAAHAINILILISPFSSVDTALKVFRLSILSLVTASSVMNAWIGAALSLVVIIIAWLLAGWSFRLMIFGTVHVWDFMTLRHRRFQPGAEVNRMFTARRIEEAPIRTYGRLVHRQPNEITFEYRPWLVLPRRSFALRQGTYFIGRGLFYPEISRVEGEAVTTCFILSPRFAGHEHALLRSYGFSEVRDVGLLKGFKAIWRWVKSLFGVTATPVPQPAAAAATSQG